MVEQIKQIDRKIADYSPVFPGTQVSVNLLFEYLDTGFDLNRFLEDYPAVAREQALHQMDRKLAEKITVDKVIHIDPETMGGTPVFMGTRVPVSFFFQYLAEGETVESFLESYPSVLREHIIALIRRAEKVMLPMAPKEKEQLPLLQAA